MLLELGILLLFILFCLTIFLALVYFGLFEDILISVGSPPYRFGGRLIAYKKEKGSYSDASALFTEVCSLVPRHHTIGIYLDEPNTSNANNCRYMVGVLLDRDHQEFESEKQLLISKGFVCGQLPDVDHVVHTSFPFKGIISVVIAIRRVYPRIKSYIVEHNLCAHPGIEVYDCDKIFFMFPLAKQDQFYQLYGIDEEKGSEDVSSDEEETEEDGNEGNDEASKTRVRSAKGSQHSSTSSSFEELIAEDN